MREYSRLAKTPQPHKSNRMACHRLKMKKLEEAGRQVRTKVVVAFHDQVPCNTCRSKLSPRASYSNMKTIRCTQLGLLLIALANVTWATGSGPRAPVFGKRVGDNSAPDHFMNAAAPMEESEEQQLHQLHQVVDTMTNLLNEQALQQQQPDHSKAEPLKASLEGSELMSESEIRLALEELEKVQQQEKRIAAAESRPQPVVAPPNGPPKPATKTRAPSNDQMQTQSPIYAGVIDELADELAEEQLTLASQEAERILKQRDYPATKSEIEKSTAVSQPTTTYRPQTDQQTLAPNTSAPQPLPSPQSLYIGRLDSLNSELGPSLTDDFYSFHGEQKIAQERPSANSEQQLLESNQKQQQHSNSFEPGYPFNDLDSAAQTRNFRQEAQQQQGFPPQPQPATFRFDVTSNRPTLSQSVPSLRPQLESFVGNSRTSGAGLVSSTENFWRPAGPQEELNSDNQFNQQFNRAFSLNQQQLPVLPQNKFHSLPPTPFPQAPPQARQSDHVHFAAHSFIPAASSQRFLLPQSNQQSRDTRTFTTTSTPMISVLSGSDTSIGNSVSWDPPATINPPPAGPRVFNSIFPVPSQQLPESQTYFPPPNRGQPALVFNPVPFQTRPDISRPPQHRQQQSAQPNLVNSRTELASTKLDFEAPETSTYEQVQPTVTSTPRTILGASQLAIERDAATTEQQPPSRLLNSNARGSFYGQESPLPVASTAASNQNSFTRPLNLRNQQQQGTASPITTTTTTSTTTITPETTTNSTKKDDMVIYYYYYYDDNKNTTVVAKNQTSRPPTLDEAIEADSGVEDTPYIEDSAPLNNAPRSRPPSTTSTTTTTLPTTRKQVESTMLRTSPKAVQASSTLKPSFKKHESRIQSDERSINVAPQQSADLFSNPFTPTPLHSAPTTSFRPAGFSNRPIVSSTDSSLIRSRPDVTEAAPVPGTRINKQQQQLVELNRNQLNQTPPKPKSSSLPVSTSTSSSSISSTSSRASNANRYGTSNNNLFLESYGIDPSSTSSISHAFGHVDMSHHQKNWQAVPSSSSGPTSVVNKKPHPKSVATLPERHVHKSDEQHFAPQRQTSSRNPTSVPQRTHQPIAPKQPAQVHTNQVIVNPGRKLFPETEKSLTNEATQEVNRSKSHDSTGTERINAHLEDQANASRESLQRFNNNGRPSTMDGNTRNSFTKAPPQLSSSSPPSYTPSPVSTTTTQRVVSASSEAPRTPSSPASSAQPTVGSTLSSIAQQSAFPPTVSYSQTESVSSASSSTAASPSSSATSSADGSPTSTAPEASSSTTETSSPSSTTEAADRSNSVTRRKFGNRNNRFQTRLDSISSTTSTTTPPPAGTTSTTRRPLSSTTRRSNKQLFAGRRRLNSPTGSEPIAPQANSTAPNNSAPTQSSVASVSTATSASRAKFGNNFTAKLRSTTTNPSDSNNRVAVRLAASSRARLAFSRTTKPTPVASSTPESVSSISGTSTAASTLASTSSQPTELTSSVSRSVSKEVKVAVTEKNMNESPLDSDLIEASPANTIEDEPNDRKEQPTPSNVSNATTTTTTTTTTSTTTANNSSAASSLETASAKPRVRPLFASRQKNQALFGNRRSASTSRR